MGGKGSGGARVGSGPKPLAADAAALVGSRRHRRAVTVPLGPLPKVEPPADLPADQLAVWQTLAPHALAQRTLSPDTADSFRDLCRCITIRNGILAKVQEDGWTYVSVRVDSSGQEHTELKKHPLVPDLRGWEQRVEAGRARFRLAPMGKEIAPPPEPPDEWAEFDQDDTTPH